MSSYDNNNWQTAGNSKPDNDSGAFSTAEMSAAINDTSNGIEAQNPADTTTASYAAAKDGWAKPEAYKYDELANDADHDWEGNARVYEFEGEIGDVGPEFPDLELQLFGDSTIRKSEGIDFSNITSLELYQEGPVRVDPIPADFEQAGLHPVMLKNVQLCGYTIPTPIQRYCLPAIRQGYDVVAVAQTGSGKTAAYLIPIINKLMGKAKKLAAPRPNPATYKEGIDPPARAEPLVCIVVPSRELAVQVFNEARKFCYRTMLRPCVVYGGGPYREQMRQLQRGCDVLVATPGRLKHFMDDPTVLTFRRLRYMVIDEADEMLQEDWKDELDQIMSGGEQEEGNINYMLFSATFPKAARELAKTHMAETHLQLRVGRAGSTHQNIKQVIVFTDPSRKKQALVDLLNSLPPTRTIIFVNSKRACDELDDLLFNLQFPCVSIHADRTQKEREASLRGFRSGKTPILITTALNARGIDVRNVMHVINYELPALDYGGIEEYVHRIGRTGRIGHRGLATSFYSERDEPLASVLTRTLLETKQEIPDFLMEYMPEDVENLKFEADSDFEEDGGADDAGGGAWGNGGDDTDDAVGGAWGNGGDAAAKPEPVDENGGW
ncbi:putative ATP-dependent RNA helicase [Cladorrhinum sp. PSN259]|nr:putative ATP-dependent RNA helicase [Cladorrhinum sp. PSN259]